MTSFAPLPMNSSRVAGTHSALVAPRMSLASCVRGYITRSTLDVPPLSELQRLNHFPAVPHCTITWFMRGGCEMLRVGESVVDFSLEPIVFSGPFTEPVMSSNPGQVNALMLSLMPGAVHLLTGIDIAPYANRMVAFDQVFDVSWQAMAHRVQQASDHAQRIALIEEFIEPLWQAARARNGLHATWFRDCLNGLALRAVTSGWVRGARQLERRFKTWTGLPMSRLRAFQRSEKCFYDAYAAYESGKLSFAEEATKAGFADQAHLCRESRRVTGLSATELVEKILHEESYWPYRVIVGEQS